MPSDAASQSDNPSPSLETVLVLQRSAERAWSQTLFSLGQVNPLYSNGRQNAHEAKAWHIQNISHTHTKNGFNGKQRTRRKANSWPKKKSLKVTTLGYLLCKATK